MRDSARRKTSKDAILDATERLLTRYGYKKMTIDDLAKEVGIGKGSIYLHFKSKEEIALSHIDRIIARLKNRVKEISKQQDPVERRLRAMLIERVMFRFDSVQHYSQSLNELLANIRPNLLERRKRYLEEEVNIFAEILGEGIERGVFEIADPMKTASSMLDATNSLLPYSLGVAELGDRDVIEDKADQVAKLILNGILKRV